MAIFEGDDPALEGPAIAVGLLQEPGSTRRQILDNLWRAERQGVLIDDIDIGQHPRRQKPPVVPADMLGIAAGIAMDQGLNRDLASSPIALAPEAKRGGGDTAVTDGAAMGAAVGQAIEAVGSGHHAIDVR